MQETTELETIIRPAVEADRAAVEAIVRDAFALYTPRIGHPAGPIKADYGALIAAGTVTVLVDGGAVAGVLVLLPEDDAMMLDVIAVATAAQGRGHGRRLIAFAEAATRQAGLAVLRLYTNEVMTESYALYRHVGFEETHRVVEDGYRRIYMRKSLHKPLPA